MPIIRGNALQGPPVIAVSVFPSLPGLTQLGSNGLSEPTANCIQCRALLDTGADGTSISRQVAELAGLRYCGKQLVTGIGGQNYHRSWAAWIGLHPDELPSLPFVLDEPVMAIELPPYPAFEVIIGRDLLMKGDFHLKSNGDFSLTI